MRKTKQGCDDFSTVQKMINQSEYFKGSLKHNRHYFCLFACCLQLQVWGNTPSGECGKPTLNLKPNNLLLLSVVQQVAQESSQKLSEITAYTRKICIFRQMTNNKAMNEAFEKKCNYCKATQLQTNFPWWCGVVWCVKQPQCYISFSAQVPLLHNSCLTKKIHCNSSHICVTGCQKVRFHVATQQISSSALMKTSQAAFDSLLSDEILS